MAERVLIGNVKGEQGATGKQGIAGKDAVVDHELDENSVNAVQNGVVTKKIKELNGKLDNCFQSVSNGKSLVASAITDKGVETATDATFNTMAENIKQIQTSVYGKYAYVDTTIQAKGTLSSLYGLYTEESEGETE